MNIFFVQPESYDAAKDLCDKHIVKMILESAQLMSTALTVHKCEEAPYKVAHLNHPSAIWVRTNRENYLWLLKHFVGLLCEYTNRYGKVHKCESLIKLFWDNQEYIPEGSFFQPPQCMPDKYKRKCSVEAYREYYRHEKNDGQKFVWKYTTKPEWL